VDIQCPIALDDERQVQMRPDIVLRDGSGIVAVADAKCKISSDGLGRTADYYQLLAYVTALALPTGLLICCQMDGDVLPRRVSVRHSGQTLESHALRLDGCIRAIEDEIEELAVRLRALGARSSRTMQAA
jgi:5-methylcytosine-specific restriction enzyme subunit McrC